MNILSFGPGTLHVGRYKIEMARFVMRVGMRTLAVVGEDKTARASVHSISIACLPCVNSSAISNLLSRSRFPVIYKPESRQYVEYGEGEDGKIQRFTHEFPADAVMPGLSFYDVIFKKVRPGGWVRASVVKVVDDTGEVDNRAAKRREKREGDVA